MNLPRKVSSSLGWDAPRVQPSRPRAALGQDEGQALRTRSGSGRVPRDKIATIPTPRLSALRCPGSRFEKSRWGLATATCQHTSASGRGLENFSPFPGLTNHSTISQELLCFLQWQCLVGGRLCTRLVVVVKGPHLAIRKSVVVTSHIQIQA